MADPQDPTPGSDRREADRREDPADAEARGIEPWIRPYFSDSTLWPVLLVVAASLGTFGATLLLLAFWERNLFAMAALGILLIGSVDAVASGLRRRRLGLIGGSVLALWGLAAGIAAAAVHFGLF